MTASKSSRGRLKHEGWWAFAFLAPFLALFLTFVVGPVLYGFWISLHEWHVLSRDVPFVGAANYRTALGDEVFRIAVARTILFAALMVPLGNLASMGLALMLNGIDRGSWFFRTAYYLPAVLSVAVVAIVWRWLYSPEFGLLNYYIGQKLGLGGNLPWLTNPNWAIPSLVLMSLWWGAGGNMLVYLAALKAVPKEQLEAASLDGAGSLGRFRWVTLPNIRGVIVFCVVMSVIAASQLFAQTLILTNGGPADSTLTVVLYMYRQGFGMYQLGYASAVAYLIFAALFTLGLTQLRTMSRAMRSD